MRESSWDLANPTGRGAVMARYSQCDGPGRCTQGSKETSLPQKATQQSDIGRPHDRRGGGLATGTDQDRTKRCFPDRFAGQFGRPRCSRSTSPRATKHKPTSCPATGRWIASSGVGQPFSFEVDEVNAVPWGQQSGHPRLYLAPARHHWPRDHADSRLGMTSSGASLWLGRDARWLGRDARSATDDWARR